MHEEDGNEQNDENDKFYTWITFMKPCLIR